MKVYKPSAKPSKERGDALGPYTQQAEFMLRAEAAVQAVAGLPWVIVRPAGERLGRACSGCRAESPSRAYPRRFRRRQSATGPGTYRA